MTLEGTNTYVIAGAREAIVIDPGPAIGAHIDAIERAAEDLGLRVAAIAVTHGHPDHAPGATLLAARTGAPVYAHAAATFAHDWVLGDGDAIEIDGATLGAIDAPGHASDHLVFRFSPEGALFSGDVVVGRGTVVVAPPGGDMRAYEATLARLRDAFAFARIYGGHGEPIDKPREKLDAYLAHRRSREEQIVAALRANPHTIPALVARIYREVPKILWPAAARQVLAHLIALQDEGRVRARPLERGPTAFESELLDPDLSRIASPAELAVARAELGLAERITTIEMYELG
jgi:glyoxylase-like metal-dependent hydrolase (beta-lactamase superfamily II)